VIRICGRTSSRIASRNVRWLARAGIITGDPADRVLGTGPGYPPGPGYVAALTTPDGMLPILRTNGVEVHTTKTSSSSTWPVTGGKDTPSGGQNEKSHPTPPSTNPGSTSPDTGPVPASSYSQARNVTGTPERGVATGRFRSREGTSGPGQGPGPDRRGVRAFRPHSVGQRWRRLSSLSWSLRTFAVLRPARRVNCARMGAGLVVAFVVGGVTVPLLRRMIAPATSAWSAPGARSRAASYQTRTNGSGQRSSWWRQPEPKSLATCS
jgi:hypothetical protein